jgi:hypothetical protein
MNDVYLRKLENSVFLKIKSMNIVIKGNANNISW